MKDSASNKSAAALATFTTPIALSTFMLAWSLASKYGLDDPRRDRYLQPRSIYDLIDKISESKVALRCRFAIALMGQSLRDAVVVNWMLTVL